MTSGSGLSRRWFHFVPSPHANGYGSGDQIMRISDVLRGKGFVGGHGGACDVRRRSGRLPRRAQRRRAPRARGTIASSASSPSATSCGVCTSAGRAPAAARRRHHVHQRHHVRTHRQDRGNRRVMTERRFRHMPVIEDDALVGIVSIGDLVKPASTSSKPKSSSSRATSRAGRPAGRSSPLADGLPPYAAPATPGSRSSSTATGRTRPEGRLRHVHQAVVGVLDDRAVGREQR